MALVNDAISDVNYIINPNSSGDLSSTSSGSPPANSDHKSFVFYPSDHHHPTAEDHSFLNFVNFGQNGQPGDSVRGDYSDDLNYGYNCWNNQMMNQRLMGDLNCFETSTTGFGNGIGYDGTGKDWLLCDATVVSTGPMQESLSSDSPSVLKRPATGENKISRQGCKKQCSGLTVETKIKTTASSKDPQSTAAKVRRERISERLKILQELVPNGTKVDMVTMLEKAISYVKFLQLQVKVLATDEFWPAQGGKAPDISQVKGAIDAILSGASNSKTD